MSGAAKNIYATSSAGHTAKAGRPRERGKGRITNKTGKPVFMSFAMSFSLSTFCLFLFQFCETQTPIICRCHLWTLRRACNRFYITERERREEDIPWLYGRKQMHLSYHGAFDLIPAWSHLRPPLMSF